MTDFSFSFGYTFFSRVVPPGALGTVALLFLAWPFAQTRLDSLDTTVTITLVAVLVLSIGFQAMLLDSVIYDLYGGSRYWPARVRRWAERRLQQRLDRAADKRCLDPAQSAETGLDAKPSISRPTELGNILLAMQSYPRARYGMPSSFYWYRIWLTVDESTRRRVDNDAATLDGTVYSSFVLACATLLHLGALSMQLLCSVLRHAPLNCIQQPWSLFFGAVVSGLASLLLYKLSLRLAHTRAEYFKSLFDLFRSNIESMTTDVSESEKQKWEATWKNLQD